MTFSFLLLLLLVPLSTTLFLSTPCHAFSSTPSFHQQPPPPPRIMNPKQQTTKKNRRTPPNKRTSMQWVIQSIEKMENVDPHLLSTLNELHRAKTQRQILQSSSKLQTHNLETQPPPIRERLLKITSLCGLCHVSDLILQSLLDDRHFPSIPSYTAYLEALRQKRKLTKMKHVLRDLNNVGRVDAVAFNSYVSALLESHQLDTAVTLLLDDEENKEWNTTNSWPDLYTYNMILNAASRRPNDDSTSSSSSYISTILHQMESRNIPKDVYTYNALLRCSSSNDVLSLLDEMEENRIIPDAFTVDLCLLPLLKENRLGRVLRLLNRFVSREMRQTAKLQKAFESFLVTLVNGGEIYTARYIFESFLLQGRGGDGVVVPTTKCFNIVLDGYRRLCAKDCSPTARSQADDLFLAMKQQTVVRPDDYTCTIMMELASSKDDVTDLFQYFWTVLPSDTWKTKTIVFHSIIKAYGKWQHPCLAIRILDRMECRNLNTWNSILSILSWDENANLVLNFEDSDDGHLEIDFLKEESSSLSSSSSSIVADLVQGMTPSQASLTILQNMHDDTSTIIQPNSQSYCLVATSLSHSTDPDIETKAIELFENATHYQIEPDGRFLNALLRCFGGDVSLALDFWKNDLRKVMAMQSPNTSSSVSKEEHLKRAYHGLMTVCGRSARADLAVRVVYAMRREGLEPDEVALRCFEAGKRWWVEKRQRDGIDGGGVGVGAMMKPYEAILNIECSKYDARDKRREGERRVRIIF